MAEPLSYAPRVPSPSLIQIGRRALLGFTLVAMVLVSIWLWFSWRSVCHTQLQRMTVSVSLAANHTQRYFDNLAIHLETLSKQIQREKGVLDRKAAQSVLLQFKARHPDLGGASLISPTGQILASTASKPGERLPNVRENPEWRADFDSNLKVSGLSINRPQFGYLLKAWLIPLRYTQRDENGNVIFLLQTSILLEKQQTMWANLGLPPDVRIGLLRDDGALLSVWPIPNGKFDPKGGIYNAVAQSIKVNAASGYYRATGDSWLTAHAGSYQRLRTYGTYAFLSAPNALFLGMWWQSVQVPIYLFLALLFLGTGSYVWMARRFAQRMQLIQRAVAQNAMHDDAALPTSGVREIDELCDALATTQSNLKAAAKNREHQLLTAADAGTYTIRLRDGVVLQADDTFLSMLGRQRSDVVGRLWGGLFEALGNQSQQDTGQYPSQELSLRVLRFQHKSGRPVWLSLAEYIDHSEGQPLRHGLAINVSQREELLAKVQRHSERLRTLWRLATERGMFDVDKVKQMLRLGLETLDMEVAMIAELDTGKLHMRYVVGNAMMFNEGQEVLVKDTLCQETVRNKRSLFYDNVRLLPDYRNKLAVAEFGIQTYVSVPIWVGEHLYGTLVFLNRALRSQAFSDEDKVFVELLAAWFGKALFEQHQHQMLETLAMTDSLTGLPNRRAAETRLSAELARARRDNAAFTVVICDLDRFKLINDHFGHDVGDEVLRHVSRIMCNALRESDWVARWGGEEFILFLHRSSGVDAYQAMERLRQDIKDTPFVTPHGNLDLTASFGIGSYRGQGDDITPVLAEADGCLYEAKHHGRDRVIMSNAANKGLLWQAGMLQHALQENRIVPAYQVMVDLITGEVVADEALARLIQPDGKILPAAEFVEAAEGINLIHVVDEIIARNALERCCSQSDPALRQRVHFINLSPQFLARRDLLDSLLTDAKQMAAGAGIQFTSRQPVVFEITERQLLEDFSAMREDLKHLLEYGFRLALDDFGSGYSSFLYLAELPISFLKIEGWMVRNMQHNDRILSMVKSMVMLAKTLDIKTIAECVEDARTAEILRDMGVDWAQGYYFGHPILEMAGTNPAIAES